MVASAAALFLYCWLPAALVAAWLWETGYPPALPPAATEIGAVVLLAGGVHDQMPPVEERLLGRETYVRSVYAAELSKRWPDTPVVISGGSPDPARPPSAAAMRDELVRRGVRADRIWLEARSRTTHENAAFTADLLRARRVTHVVLVTSASHMRRAEASFRRQGVQVTPAPCAHYSTYTLPPREFLWPSWRAILWNDGMLHEILGMAWYRVNGRL